ncbi:MAG TPA: DUF433 domain-containing protein [Thermoanaerobaculia bacterium]|jgi:uncharacterized protein (DUF433 family)|nr:DUF433 domain-containing protein [Thermoanaerobaculia bacterium]
MFDRIISNPEILGGKPCVKGTRISVEFLLELVAQGASRADILTAYPHLTAEDVEQALRYASRFLENEVVISTETPEMSEARQIAEEWHRRLAGKMSSDSTDLIRETRDS